MDTYRLYLPQSVALTDDYEALYRESNGEVITCPVDAICVTIIEERECGRSPNKLVTSDVDLCGFSLDDDEGFVACNDASNFIRLRKIGT